MAEKNKYWWGVLYPENMIENWKDEISEKLQLPFAYCIHDKCKDEKGEHRKTHVHLIVAFKNSFTLINCIFVFCI